MSEDRVIALASPVSETEPAGEKNGVHGKGIVRPNNRLTSLTQFVLIISAVLVFGRMARAVLLPVMLAWVISMTLKPLVRWLKAWHVPTPVGAALVVTLVVALAFAGAVHLSKPAVEWLQAAPENFPRLKDKFQNVLRPAARLQEAASSVSRLEPPESTARKAQPVEVRDNRMPGLVFSWTSSLLAGIGETVVLVFMLLIAGDGMVSNLVRAMPRLRDKKKALEISHEIQQSISRYLLTVGLVNVCFGLVVGTALYFLDMPNPVMWGVVAALLNFIPYFGPVVGTIILGLAGLLAFDSLGRGLLPAAAYLAAHLIESNAVTPFVLGRRFLLSPVIIFVTLLFGVWLWGVAGALLAVPLLVTAKVICERVPALATAAEFLAGQESR